MQGMYAITDVFGARKRSSNRHRCPQGLFCCYETRFFQAATCIGMGCSRSRPSRCRCNNRAPILCRL